MNEEKEEVSTAHATQPNILEKLDPTTNMNRKQLREYGRFMTRKIGNFTKPSLAARTAKRRAVKKVGRATRKAQRA